METAAKSQRRKLLVLLAWCLLLMLAWGLWLYRLDASDLTFDETATYAVAHQPLLDMLHYLRVGAVREHPPVYYLLMHVWMVWAGTGEFSLRFFSVSAGLVALALIGWLTRLARWNPRRSAGAAGLVPAVLLVVVPGMAYYARDARMYSLGVVWTLLSAGVFLRDWLPTSGWPRRAALLGLVTVHLLALFTHYYLLLPILVQPLALLIARRWRPLLAWCVLHGLPALAGLAWLWLAPSFRATVESLWPHLALGMPTRAQVLGLVDGILFSPVIFDRLRLLYLVLILAGVGVLLALWRSRPLGVWLALTLTVPLALAYVVPHPPQPRHLIFLTPLVALALGCLCIAPLHLAKRRWLAWGATFGLTLVGIRLLIGGGLHLAITYEKSNYGHVLKMVKAYARPGDGVLFYGPWQWVQFRYYDPGGMPPITTLPPHAPPHLQLDEAEPVLEQLLAEYGRLWVIPAAVGTVDPPHLAEGWLRTHAHAVWDTARLSLYLPPLPPDAPSRLVQAVFGDALLLERVSWKPGPIQAGDPLRLTLHWTPVRHLEDDVVLTLELVDASGRVWVDAFPTPGKWGYPPSEWEPGETVADYEGLMIPQGAPPGEYVVRLRIGEGAEVDLLSVAVDHVDVAPPRDDLPRRAYLPLIFAQGRGPVLYGLPNADAATFCAPDGVNCVDLAGYEPGGARFPQGYPIPLTLHWLSPERPLPALHLRLRVVRRPWLPVPGLKGAPVLTQTLPLAPTYPAPRWTPNRLVTLPTALALPPGAPTGRAQVTLEVLGPDGSPWPTTEGDADFPLFDVTVEGRSVLRRLPRGLRPIQVDFGEEVGLRGYRVEGGGHPGGQLRVTYAWYARARPTAIYAIFNHLLAADGTLVAQADGWPQGGRMVSTQWQAGEYVEDGYALEIPPDAPPGPYTLYVGVYNAANDDRQPAFQDGQRLPDDRLSIPLPGEEER
jgi:mannosyltransferase